MVEQFANSQLDSREIAEAGGCEKRIDGTIVAMARFAPANGYIRRLARTSPKLLQ
ncbi:hypothetical protein IU514_18435 [Lysobacter niastensis]|uniref:Uncharacterized protein n=1 Tax=Lysobacter niastensis TaxID=380629 RepID=A0ABS0BB05_9GAMM|nr:hypothetical protein [Lysobacter niastensis]